jgi:hypothetical protein
MSSSRTSATSCREHAFEVIEASVENYAEAFGKYRVWHPQGG